MRNSSIWAAKDGRFPGCGYDATALCVGNHDAEPHDSGAERRIWVEKFRDDSQPIDVRHDACHGHQCAVARVE